MQGASDIPADAVQDDVLGKGGAEPAARSVVVVDDDPDFAESLVGLLRMEGYEAVSAPDTASALATLAERDFAVALVDVRLGLESGVDLLRILRQRAPDLVAVMVTAYASIETAIEALKAGAYDYLSKPFHTEDLLATLERCFERIRLYQEKQNAEEKLRQVQRMEAIGELTSGAAHDFNNILSVIFGNLRLLREEVVGHAALRELVDDALEAAKAGTELTDRLLAFGRTRPNGAVATDLREALSPFSRLLGRTLGEGIAIEVVDAAELDLVLLDPALLEASLLSLAINARDAMPEGGKLTFETRNIAISAADTRVASGLRPGRYVVLSVIDTGRGMTQAVLRRALEPFFTTKPPGRGSGLGLAMVDGFVRQSGGRVGVSSRPGDGTRINLYFPSLERPSSKRQPSGAANM